MGKSESNMSPGNKLVSQKNWQSICSFPQPKIKSEFSLNLTVLRIQQQMSICLLILELLLSTE